MFCVFLRLLLLLSFAMPIRPAAAIYDQLQKTFSISSPYSARWKPSKNRRKVNILHCIAYVHHVKENETRLVVILTSARADVFENY